MLLSVCRNVFNRCNTKEAVFSSVWAVVFFESQIPVHVSKVSFHFLCRQYTKYRVSLEKCSRNTQTYALMSRYLRCVIMSHRVSWGGIESNTVVCNRRGNLSHEWDLAAFSRFLPFLELFAQQILVVQMWPEHSFNISPFEWSFPWPPSGFSIDF